MRTHAFSASLVQGELANLPFEDGAFDFAIAIACYHHLEGEDIRAAAFRELRRILRPGGEAFISVWNHEQPRFAMASQDVLVPWGDEDSASHGTTTSTHVQNSRPRWREAGFRLSDWVRAPAVTTPRRQMSVTSVR
jgi:SAM-dependent methyltransferase